MNRFYFVRFPDGEITVVEEVENGSFYVTGNEMNYRLGDFEIIKEIFYDKKS